MSNYPAPVGDSAISGLSPVTTPLTIHDLLIISIKLNDAYYTGKITLEQIRRFFLDNTVALEISGMIGLMDGKSNTGHKHTSSDLTDLSQLMATKANATHTHTTAQVTGLSTLLEGKANTIHTHDINAINGLVSALGDKADSQHTHKIEDIVGLKSILDSFEEWTTNAGSSHEHQMNQIVGLDDRFADKADTQHNHQIENIEGLVDELNNKANVDHTHTAADFENIAPLLANKADSVHTHFLEEVTGLELALDDKADARHRHALDDVDGLRDELNEKAPTEHNHAITSVDGLTLALDNKSDLDHNHLMVQVEGLEETLAQKANNEHSHTAEDIADLNTVLATKANSQHNHTIDEVVNLRASLNDKESVSNKVNNLDVPSDVAFPTVNGVINGVNELLLNYNFPVLTVNGQAGDVSLTKTDLELGKVDNTSDREKPLSEAAEEALSGKVDQVLLKFDVDATPGRVAEGDDYVTIIQKLQWQIDVLRGLLVEPIENALEIIPDGYSLKFVFDKEVKFRNNLLSANNFDARTLFNTIITTSIYEDHGFRIDHTLISIEAVENELTITLEPDWIKPEELAAVDSIDQGGPGTGIVRALANLDFKNLISVDGSLVNPADSEIDLTIHTNLSGKGIAHNDEVYDRVVVLGTWAAVPFYGYTPPDTTLGFNTNKETLVFNFSRDIFIDGKSMAAYEGTGVELFTRLFENTPEMQNLLGAIKASHVTYTATKRELQLTFKSGFVDASFLEQLDVDRIGVYKLELELNIDLFTSIDDEDIVLGRSSTFVLTLFSNASAKGKPHTPELYQKITVLGTWADEPNYENIPTLPVEDLQGECVLEAAVKPVSNLAGQYVHIPDVVPVSDLSGAYNDE